MSTRNIEISIDDLLLDPMNPRFASIISGDELSQDDIIHVMLKHF